MQSVINPPKNEVCAKCSQSFFERKTRSMNLNFETFAGVVQKSGLLDQDRLQRALVEFSAANDNTQSVPRLAEWLIRENLLTKWQADKLLQGKHRGYFLGKYKLLSLLGKGGMSSVYLAEHLLMRRQCALKVLPAKRVDDSSYLERFHREAQAAASLDHPNIVRAYDVDHQDDGNRQIHFLVMEYVEGTSLQELVPTKGMKSILDAAEYTRQAALGLQHAHENGMVHRDIKPGNLLVDLNGVVKILDLGLARFFRVDEGNEALTLRHDEKVLGTADYLAPEQALDSHTVDARADLYSLGCTLYFMVTGQPPFTEGTLAQRLIAHQMKTPTAVESLRVDLPLSLAAIIRKMMEKQPDDRYANAAEIEADLFHWIDENADSDWRRAHLNVYGSRTSESDVAIPVAKPIKSAAATLKNSTPETPEKKPEITAKKPETPLKLYPDATATAKTPGLPAFSIDPVSRQKIDNLPETKVLKQTPPELAPAPHSLEFTTKKKDRSVPRRSMTAVWGLAVLVLAGLSGLVYFGTRPSAKITHQKPPQPIPFPPEKQEVSVGGKTGEYSSIRDALIAVRDRYRPGLRSLNTFTIKVAPGTYADRIRIDGRIQSWPEGVKLMGMGEVRLSPTGSDPVIRVANISRLTLENLQIDASEKDVAVELSDDLHETRLIQLRVSGFSKTGIVCKGAQGLSFADSQLLLDQLQFDAASPQATGIQLDASTENEVNNLIIRNCRFLHPMQAGITLQGRSPYGIKIIGCLFNELTEGVRFDGEPQLRLISVTNNTFRKTRHGILFSQTPHELSTELGFRRNLFIGVGEAEVAVKPKFDEPQFRAILAPNSLGIQNNWSDRIKPATPKTAEVTILFENGGRQGEQNLLLFSTDPSNPKFLAPTEKSPHQDIAGAQPTEYKWIGAVGP